MTDEQAKMIFEQVICEHWPNWPRGAEELMVWIKTLRRFDFNVARNAINNLYETWEKTSYPKMPHILGAIKRYAKGAGKGRVETRELYTIMRPDGRRRWTPFWGPASLPQEDIEEDASWKLERANHIEAGHYIQYAKREEEAVPF